MVRTLLSAALVVLTELVVLTVWATRMVSMFRERLSMVSGPVRVMSQLRRLRLSRVLSRASVMFLMDVAVLVVVLRCVGPGVKLNRLIGWLAAVSRLVVIGASSWLVVVTRLCRVLLRSGLAARLVRMIGYGADRLVKVSVRGLAVR